MCVCVRLCVSVYLCACVHACMHACVRACVLACVRACLPACVCVRACACLPACVRACVHACMHACVRVFMRVALLGAFFVSTLTAHSALACPSSDHETCLGCACTAAAGELFYGADGLPRPEPPQPRVHMPRARHTSAPAHFSHGALRLLPVRVPGE